MLVARQLRGSSRLVRSTAKALPYIHGVILGKVMVVWGWEFHGKISNLEQAYLWKNGGDAARWVSGSTVLDLVVSYIVWWNLGIVPEFTLDQELQPVLASSAEYSPDIRSLSYISAAMKTLCCSIYYIIIVCIHLQKQKNHKKQLLTLLGEKAFNFFRAWACLKLGYVMWKLPVLNIVILSSGICL